MMRTWSLEETLIRAQSAVAVAIQGVWDVFTHRPAYSNSHPIPGCPNPSDCRGFGCAGDCSEASDADERLSDKEAEEEAPEPDWVAEFVAAADRREYFRSIIREELDSALDSDSPNHYEPGLGDDELVGVRGLLQERYETSACVPRNGPAEHPAGGLTHSPVVPPAGPQLDWHGWAEPAICEALTGHRYSLPLRQCECQMDERYPFEPTVDEQGWREHVAPIIASRLACDPARAIAALHNHKPQ